MSDFWKWQEDQENLRRDRRLGRVQPSQMRSTAPTDYEVREQSWTETQKHRILKFFDKLPPELKS